MFDFKSDFDKNKMKKKTFKTCFRKTIVKHNFALSHQTEKKPFMRNSNKLFIFNKETTAKLVFTWKQENRKKNHQTSDIACAFNKAKQFTKMGRKFLSFVHRRM